MRILMKYLQEKSWMSELFFCPEKLFKLCLFCLQITPLSVSSRESNSRSYLLDPNCGFKGLRKFNSMQNQTRTYVWSQWWRSVKSLLCQIKMWTCPALPAALCHWLHWDDRAVAVSRSGSQTSSNSKIENKWFRHIQITVRLSSFHRSLSQTLRRKKMHCKKIKVLPFLKKFLLPSGASGSSLGASTPGCDGPIHPGAALRMRQPDLGTSELIRCKWLFDTKWLLLPSLTPVLNTQISANIIFACDTNSARLTAPITATVWVLPAINEGMLGTPLRHSQVL